MSFPGFASLANAWLLLLLVPLIIFYFLKLKRPRMEVPSLALWRQALNDQRVNSPFQRFKRNMLLLLQILLLLFLALAAMQPFLPSGAERAEYLPVLIDTSASMAAPKTEGGPTRLDEVKERVGRLIDDMLPDQRLSLIAFNSSARRLTEFTDNKRVLHSALERLEVEDVPSNPEDALRMTQALARTEPIEKVLLYSDGNIPPKVNFELSFRLDYQQVDPGGPNVGITALNARRTGSDTWEVFARVESTDRAPASATLQLTRSDAPDDSAEETLVLDAGESQRIVFPVSYEGSTSLEVRLQPEGFDSLAADNVAYLDMPVVRPLTVYCPLELETYRHALAPLEEIVVYPDEDESTASHYDLLISDLPEHAELDATVSMFVGVVPDDLKNLVGIETGLAEIVDWERDAPLLQHVLFSEVQISDEPRSAEGVVDGDFEDLGYEIVAYGRSGPLLLQRREGAKVAYYMLFHSDRSTLPYRVGFPILVANLVEIAMRNADLSEVRAASTPVLPPRTLAPDTEYRITGPDGSRYTTTTNREGRLSGVAAPHVGRYVVSEGLSDAASIGVGLLNSEESGLSSIETIQFPEDLAVAASANQVKTDRPLWRTFAWLAFGMLLVEWWYFQRRPVGLPEGR